MEILYQDSDIVVVVKPSGFLSVPGKGPDKLDSVSHRIRTSTPGCIPQPAVHRLDMDTSGIMVLGLTVQAHRHLSIQFQERQTQKEYQALLEGELRGDCGTIHLPFRLDVENRPFQIYDEIHGKMGTTHWKRVGIENGFTRINFFPVTGRTHQLRIHCAHPKGLGIPIVGDTFYGSGTINGQLKLHAKKLVFTHPTLGKEMTFESSVPF